MIILFKITTRSRPEKYLALLQNIAQKCDLSKHLVVVSADYDDMTMKGMENVIYGHSKNKIDAINRDIPKNGWDILVNVSDDQRFTKVGFDKDIIEAFGGNLDQFIHFPDGYTDTRLCSMSIMGRTYYERFGYIYHPDYVSLFCDNEAKDVAELLGCYKYVDKNIFIHQHPAWTGDKPDAQLIETQRYYRADEKIYLQRKSRNFDLINTNTKP
jgi:hypothetical protein